MTLFDFTEDGSLVGVISICCFFFKRCCSLNLGLLFLACASFWSLSNLGAVADVIASFGGCQVVDLAVYFFISSCLSYWMSISIPRLQRPIAHNKRISLQRSCLKYATELTGCEVVRFKVQAAGWLVNVQF